MKSAFATLLEPLARHRGVLGCLVAGEEDGIVVDALLQERVDGPALAALAAALHRRSRWASGAAGLGAVSFLRLDASRGHSVRARPRRTGARGPGRNGRERGAHPLHHAACGRSARVTTVAADWVEAPLRPFVEEANILFALLLHPSGQVLGQHGFTRAVDVMAACALAAGISASAGALGREVGGVPFGELHHAGRERQIFMADVPTAHERYVLLAVFDRASSLGLVQLYFREFRERLAAASPGAATPAPTLAADFERELDRSLAALFGRAPRLDVSGRPLPPSP